MSRGGKLRSGKKSPAWLRDWEEWDVPATGEGIDECGGSSVQEFRLGRAFSSLTGPSQREHTSAQRMAETQPFALAALTDSARLATEAPGVNGPIKDSLLSLCMGLIPLCHN